MKINDLYNKHGDKTERTGKILFLATLIVVSFIIYTLKLFSMQILEGQAYKKQSVSISQRLKTIPAQRGEIFDRNASLAMVINTDSFAVDLIPGEVPAGKYDSVAARLAQLLGISKNQIDTKIPESIRRSYTTVEIKANIPFETISNIAENIVDLPGVSWRSKPIRNYVETGSIAHVIGYVGDITKEELKVLYNQGYTNTSIVGKTGIEKQYDELLQGISGTEARTVDVRGRLVSEAPSIKTPVMGKNLVLTIDMSTQTLVEKALGDRVGAAVVLKPATGEILAMVSYPYYDANIFSTDNAAAAYTELAAGKNNPLLNRAVNAVYPPASTFKTVMTTAVLAEESFPPDKKIECSGAIDYGDRIFKCHIGYPGHGHLDLKNGLAQSCNVYFWTIGRDYLGVDRISSYAKEFGMGKSLEIDLPSQSEGFIPTAQWKERRYHEKWLGGDTMSMSIGQGYSLVTPLHVADMMAMVVNSGKIYRPHLLKEVRNPATNEIIEEIKPEILVESNISESVWNEVRNDLRYTVTNGSASGVLKNKVVQFAGKTGTAEVTQYTDRWHSWFVAYGPFDAPPEDTIVVVVLVEAINPWEWWAPYASNIIFQGYFGKQTYEDAVDALGFRYLMKPIGRQE